MSEFIDQSEPVNPNVFIGPKNKSKSRSRSSPAASKIQRFYKQRKTRKSILKNVGNLYRRVNFSSRRISTFFRNNPNVSEKVAETLHGVCASSGFCLAIGSKEVSIINHYFKQFRKFAYLRNIQSIGIESQNGFVNLLHYQRNQYNAYAVMKTTMNEDSSNLMYEYWVGQFINKKNKQFSCFLETYGLFKSKHAEDKSVEILRDLPKKPSNVTKPYMNALIEPIQTIDWNEGCREAASLHLLIQHIPTALSMYDAISKHKIHLGSLDEMESVIENIEADIVNLQKRRQSIPISSLHSRSIRKGITDAIELNSEKLENIKSVFFQERDKKYKTQNAPNRSFHPDIEDDFLYILYQIYKPLSVLANVFTHYDLHLGNVLLYRPFYESNNSGYIHYKYVLPMKDEGEHTIEFDSSYIVKIIDYGECYVNAGPQYHSNEIAKKLCDKQANPDCNITMSCGRNNGFKKFSKVSTSRRFSDIRNISHDLRFANLCSIFFVPTSEHGRALDKLLKNVVYGVGIMNLDKTMGTIEQSSGYPEKINNVVDMARSLEDLIQSELFSRINTERYAEKRKMGTLTMYCNGTGTPMKWEPL